MEEENLFAQDLENFPGWEDGSNAEDFFKTLDNNSEEEEKDDLEEQAPKGGQQPLEEEEEEEDLFSLEDDQDNVPPVSGDDDDDEDDEDQDRSLTMFNYMRERGLLDVELEEGEELTPEEAEELIEEGFHENVNKTIKALFEDFPPEVKGLYQYVSNGGSFQEYISKLYSGSNADLDVNMELDTEEKQILAIKTLLRGEDYDNDYIDAQVEFLKDSGKLETIAKKRFNKWKASQEAERQNIVAQQEQYQKQQRELKRKALAKTQEYLNNTSDIEGLTVSRTDKKELPSYMIERNIALENGNKITQLQKELLIDLPKNDKAYMQLAVLMKNRNEDGTFNFDAIKREAETKASTKIKNNIRRSKNRKPNASKKSQRSTQVDLLEVFGDN